MRNEGPFILEWLSWYRMLGFSRVLVVTNDCTDHSPALLDALEAAGLVTHLRCQIKPGASITAAKLKLARQHPAVTKAEWVFVCDVDEFLVIHAGAGRLSDLIAAVPPFLGMAIPWRVFGSSGIESFHDLPVHRQFFTAIRADRGLSCFVKTLYRHPRWFRQMGEHGPRGFKPHKAEFGAEGNIWVNARGQIVPQWQPEGDYIRFLPPDLAGPGVAQVNHYMIRSEESFSLKSGTLSPAGLKPRYDVTYHARASYRDETDTSATLHTQTFDAEWRRILALPGILRLHHLCCADHLTAIAQKAGRDAAEDPRIAHHLDLARRA